MWPVIIVGGLVATGATLAFLDSRKLRIGDVAKVPVGGLRSAITLEASSNAAIQLGDVLNALKIKGGSVDVLTTKRDGDSAEGLLDSAGLRVPVKFNVKDVAIFTRAGTEHPGGR